MTNDAVQIVFDIGGTKTRIAKVVGGALDDIQKFPTPPNPEEGLRTLAEFAKKICGSARISALCGDISGIVKDGVICLAPHLPEWNGTAIAATLQKHAGGAPVTLFNDGELVALGEYFYGAGKGSTFMLYVTVSTGVGGAFIVEGEVRRGMYNAEFGHQIIDNGTELEALVSGTAIEKKYGISPKDFNDAKALAELADTLAVGLYNTTLHLFPETIVLGGSMIVGGNAIPLARVEKTFNAMVKKYYPTAPVLRAATLDSEGGLYGGMGYLQAH